MDRPVTVLVVDDQEPFRAAARRLIGHADRFTLVGEAADLAGAVALTAATRPDLVLLDIGLPDGSGVDGTRRIVAAHPATVVVLVSTYARDDLPAGAEHCGARAYLHKEDLTVDVLGDLLAGSSPVATMFE